MREVVSPSRSPSPFFGPLATSLFVYLKAVSIPLPETPVLSCSSCYESCLALCLEHGIRSIAFPCISTGAYGYPSVEAADVALTSTRRWLLAHSQAVDRIMFVTRRPRDEEAYGWLMLALFPPL